MTESESKELPPITVHEDIIKQFDEGGLAGVFAFLGRTMHDDAGRRTANKNPAWAEVPKGSLLSLSALFDSLSLMLPGAPPAPEQNVCTGCGTPQEFAYVTRCPECPNEADRVAERVDAAGDRAPDPERFREAAEVVREVDAMERHVFTFTYTPQGFAEMIADPAQWSEPMAPQGEQAATEISDPDPKS